MTLLLRSIIDIDVHFERNTDQVLITQYGDHDQEKEFRIRIASCELIIERWVIHPALNTKIERRLIKSDIKLIYNRFYFKGKCSIITKLR